MSNAQKSKSALKTCRGSGLTLKRAGRSRLSRFLEVAVKAQEDAEAVRNSIVKTLDGYPFAIDEQLFERFSETHTVYNQVPRELGNTLHVEARRQHMEISEADLDRIRKGLEGMARRLEPKEKKNGPGILPDIPIPGLLKNILKPGPKHQKLVTRYIKGVARVAGADLVGVAPFDPHWIYSRQQINPFMADAPVTKEIRIEDVSEPEELADALIIPSDACSVVLCAFGMDKPLDSTLEFMFTQGWLSGSHIRMGVAAVAVAEFIRKQGYWAIPDTNRLGINVPMAALAGIGEIGRNGLLITPELGSYLRLSKVITNMPLQHDKPVSFGVAEYCAACATCASACPGGAITYSRQSWKGANECNHHGTLKWYNDYKKCISYWVKTGRSCSNCISACPFTKKTAEKAKNKRNDFL